MNGRNRCTRKQLDRAVDIVRATKLKAERDYMAKVPIVKGNGRFLARRIVVGDV